MFKRILKHSAKAVILTLIFAFLLGELTNVMITSSNVDVLEYQWISGIYEEEEGSLDAVYIGSSNCYAFWNQNAAWEEYGIAVYPFCSSSQPITATEYLIKEARKRQPDALYIVNINSLGEIMTDSDEAALHWMLDYMPFSLNKLELTDHMCDLAGFSFSERLEFYFPIIRYHGRWSELTERDFSGDPIEMKSANRYTWYLGGSEDISEVYKVSDTKTEVSDTIKETVNSLLDYCDEENVKALFVAVPRTEADVETVQKINTVCSMIEERGYDTLNLIGKTGEIGLDLTRDYYNEGHTNVHGSLKYTYYLSEYLVENYGFEDKRENEEYQSWNESSAKYSKILPLYTLDFESDSAHRAFDMRLPDGITAVIDGSSINVTWNACESADGYAVYRKLNTGVWKFAGLSYGTVFEEKNINTEYTYKYRVVPFREENGEKFYGTFPYAATVAE